MFDRSSVRADDEDWTGPRLNMYRSKYVQLSLHVQVSNLIVEDALTGLGLHAAAQLVERAQGQRQVAQRAPDQSQHHQLNPLTFSEE